MNGKSLVLLVFLGLACCIGWQQCSRRYPDLGPGVRAFKIPVNHASTDSTLCLFSVPPDYDPGRAYPVLVALHGGGSNAAMFHDLWLPVTQSAGTVLVTPQGGQPFSAGIGYTWGESGGTVVQRCLDVVLSKVNINRTAIFIAGFSDGGRLAYDLAFHHPDVFAGCAALGVGFGLPDSTAAAGAGNMRLYIGHGELEPGLEDVRDFAERLSARGMRVRFVVYPGIGHGIPTPVDRELENILDFFSK